MSIVTIENSSKRQITLSMTLDKPLPESVQKLVRAESVRPRPALKVMGRVNSKDVLEVHLGSSLDNGVAGALQPKLQLPEDLHKALMANKANAAAFRSGGDLRALPGAH